MTRYEVRFIVYQYNGGAGIPNGNQRHKQSFDALEPAQELQQRLLTMLRDKESTREWAGQYVWDGFLERVEGIYEVTERKIA